MSVEGGESCLIKADTTKDPTFPEPIIAMEVSLDMFVGEQEVDSNRESCPESGCECLSSPFYATHGAIHSIGG